MTLAAVWIENRAGRAGPLCFASDSRTTPGPIEGVNKVILFRRPDIAAVWAGDFRYAALLASHLDAVLTATEAMRERHIDVARALPQAGASARRHLEGVIRPGLPDFQQNDAAREPEKTSIVVGGYSIEEGRHVLLRIDWAPHIENWTTSVKAADPERIVFIGDGRVRAKQVAKSARKHRKPDGLPGWAMEPLAAICLASDDDDPWPTVGGDVQLAKAYMHGSANAYGVFDPKTGFLSVRGSRVSAAAGRELVTRGLAIDLSRWLLADAAFATPRQYEAPDVGR